MKKTLRIMGLCALVVALFATSCKKEEKKLTESFTAELTQPTSDAKTHIGSYNGTSNYLLWNSGDQIKVFDAGGNAYTFSTTNGNVPVATFTGNTALDEEAAYCAFYPAANAISTGGYVYLTLSENQAYADGTFATGTYPIAATNGGSGTTFTFHSPCGVLAIPFKGSGTIGSIELTGKQNEALAGQLQINPVGFDPENPSFSMVNPVTTITLTCANGLVLNAENAKACMFVVPEGVFAQGFTAVVKDLNHNEIYTLETTKDNTIVAEQIMWMPTVNVAALAVTTDEAVVGENSVTLNGHFTVPEGVTVSEAGFYWGAGSMERVVSAVNNNSISFTIAMEDLIQGTTYNFYAFAKNGNVETIGTTLTFTIEAPATAPVVVTGPEGHETPDLSVGTAVCYGGIESLDDISEYGICYSTESFSKATVQYVQSDNWTNGLFSATLSGLGNGSTIYYRAYAVNTAGYGYGEIKSFTTPDAPTVTTNQAAEITTTTAVCGGNVTADGGMTVTARGVCYGTSHNPTTADSHTTNGTGTGSFTSSLEGLTPNTTYYVRAYATNGVATSYGDEVEFTTEEEIIITLPTVTTNAVTNITTNSATVGGQITDAGNGTIAESGICYKTGTGEWTCVAIAANNNAFSMNLTGLTANTTYTVRAYATNEAGTGYGEEKTFTTEEEIIITVPTVTTNAVTDITTNSATVGGQITSTGNGTISESGICYKTGTDEWTCVAIAANNNAFSMTLTGLTANTSYTVRAYATNEEGTGYGEEVSFTTLEAGGGNVPTGAIDGLFTINSNGDQVYFSQGNLQYNKATNEWSFTEHQYDIVETQGQNVGQNYADQNIVSLFGWGTSGYNHGASAYQPLSTGTSESGYYAYGAYTNNLYDGNGKADWGYNAISNGGNAENSGWRTLSRDEWNYVFYRTTTSGIRWAQGTVNGINGTILLPDNWNATTYTLNDTNGGNYDSNTITAADWTNVLEANGAVFLPAAGCRWGTSVSDVGSWGYYWSASYFNRYHARCLVFSYGLSTGTRTRSYGQSVRLVRNIQ